MNELEPELCEYQIKPKLLDHPNEINMKDISDITRFDFVYDVSALKKR